MSSRDLPEFRPVECTDDEQPRRQSAALVDHLLALQPSASLYRVSYLVKPEPGRHDELLQTLCALAKEIRNDPGCVVCTVCVEDRAGLFLVVSAWKSAADLQAHLHSERSRMLSGDSLLPGATSEVGLLTSERSGGGSTHGS